MTANPPPPPVSDSDAGRQMTPEEQTAYKDFRLRHSKKVSDDTDTSGAEYRPRLSNPNFDESQPESATNFRYLPPPSDKPYPPDPDAGYVRPHAEIHADLLAANLEISRLKAAPSATLKELLLEIDRLWAKELLNAMRSEEAARNAMPVTAKIIAARQSVEQYVASLEAERRDLRREAVLAFYNGASATTRRYVTNQEECDKAIDDINDACDRALRRISSGSSSLLESTEK